MQQALQGRDATATVGASRPQPKRVLQVHATPQPDGGALVLVEDISERSRLDAVRTDFVANISHELKTPVGALAVLAEALVDEDDLEVVHRLAGKMVNEAHQRPRRSTICSSSSASSSVVVRSHDPVDVRQVLATR